MSLDAVDPLVLLSHVLPLLAPTDLAAFAATSRWGWRLAARHLAGARGDALRGAIVRAHMQGWQTAAHAPRGLDVVEAYSPARCSAAGAPAALVVTGTRVVTARACGLVTAWRRRRGGDGGAGPVAAFVAAPLVRTSPAPPGGGVCLLADDALLLLAAPSLPGQVLLYRWADLPDAVAPRDGCGGDAGGSGAGPHHPALAVQPRLVLHAPPGAGQVASMALCDPHVAVACTSGAVLLFDVYTGARVREAPPPAWLERRIPALAPAPAPLPVGCAAAPDDGAVAVAYENGRVLLLSADDGDAGCGMVTLADVHVSELPAGCRVGLQRDALGDERGAGRLRSLAWGQGAGGARGVGGSLLPERGDTLLRAVCHDAVYTFSRDQLMHAAARQGPLSTGGAVVGWVVGGASPAGGAAGRPFSTAVSPAGRLVVACGPLDALPAQRRMAVWMAAVRRRCVAPSPSRLCVAVYTSPPTRYGPVAALPLSPFVSPGGGVLVAASDGGVALWRPAR